jgi:hypothetical protein
MGLGSSKEARDITISASDVGVVRISEAAVDNIKESIDIKNNAVIPKVEERFRNEDEKALAARLEEYEKNLIQNFKKASKDVELLFRDRYKSIPVCLDLQQTVMNCYSQNPKYPLKCLDISEQYIKCVENERLNRFKVSSPGA